MISIEKKLLDEISAYCRLNNIKEMSNFATELLRKAFMVEKYGDRPGCLAPQPEKAVERTDTPETGAKHEQTPAPKYERLPVETTVVAEKAETRAPEEAVPERVAPAGKRRRTLR